MRIVEWSGHPVGDAQPAGAGSQSGMPQRPEVLGPAADSEPHHFGSRLLDPLAARHGRQRAQAEDLARSASGAEIKGARKLGARHAAADLQEHLGDDWVLFHGLQTTTGPISQLLLGPSGLIALTSLYLTAKVHCHGDKWHAEKPLNHAGRPGQPDQPHGRQPTLEMSLNDHEGRSPSAQLNQAADTFERFLRAAGLQLRVERVVLLNYPRPREDELHRPTVRVIGSTSDFLTWLHKLPKFLDRGQKRQIENLIAGGDHDHPPAAQT